MILWATWAVGVMVLPSSARAGKAISDPITQKNPNLKMNRCIELL